MKNDPSCYINTFNSINNLFYRFFSLVSNVYKLKSRKTSLKREKKITCDLFVKIVFAFFISALFFRLFRFYLLKFVTK